MKKLNVLSHYLISLILIPTFYTIVFSQAETKSVPAKWEYYSGKDKKVSFLMPRLPVFITESNPCRGENTEVYAGYNDGVVYTVRITSKVELSKFCSQKKDFDENNFAARVTFLKSEKADLKEESDARTGIVKDSVVKLVGNIIITRLINDYDNKRWFEFNIYGADEKKPEVKSFLASLKTAGTTGIAIGQGADQTFGDEVSDTNAEIKVLQNINDTDGKITEESVTEITLKIKDTFPRNFAVILKPRAGYTDNARRNKVQGKVLLRVTFLANGAIGNITVVRGLPDGLTEEAVKTAGKMVFIPSQKDGTRSTVTKPVEYSFSIF